MRTCSRGRRRQRGIRAAARQVALGLPARHDLGLQPLGRRARPGDRSRLGKSLYEFEKEADFWIARHEGYGFLRHASDKEDPGGPSPSRTTVRSATTPRWAIRASSKNGNPAAAAWYPPSATTPASPR